ncbi:MAG: UDP-N-acetylmuramate dehydrogenase [Tissierellia bacterium]|nr:UDP-N-acetylmuramate dehydrogenase [Tissierellia bacterium]
MKNWGRVTEGKEMKELTTFRIGGPVDFFAEPNSVEEVRNILADAKDQGLDWMVMGAGSNLLVSDKGIRGIVMRLGDRFSSVHHSGTVLTAGAMASLADVANYTVAAGLTGLEFSHGIPGTVGGAMTMNAGAYDGEMKDVVLSVTALTPDGELVTYSNAEMDFGYRHSRVYEEHLIVLSVDFQLAAGEREQIQGKIDDFWQRRNAKQPLEMASAGSTFKRPVGYYAGQLIDQAGLRGIQHRGAQVSQKHCGFVVNTGEATCQDVVELIHLVQEAVYAKHGVELEPEVKVIGEL